jgi:hypothetical protein
MCPMCLCVSKKNFNLSADKGRLDHVIIRYYAIQQFNNTAFQQLSL